MKYILFASEKYFNLPVLFPDCVPHREVAQQFAQYTPIGAGFVKVREDGKFQVYSNSVSLKLKSSQRDEDAINLFLGELK